MPYVVNRDVYVEINAVPLATDAWECLNPLELHKPAARRGQDRLIPGAAGVRAKTRRADVTRRQLQLVVTGKYMWDGTLHANSEVGVVANLDHLAANLFDAQGDPVTATVHLPDATTVTGSVQVESLDWEFHGYDATVTIDITIPAGALA
jgi:hypothetical protein